MIADFLRNRHVQEPNSKNQEPKGPLGLEFGSWDLVLAGLEANIEVRDSFQGIGLRSGDGRGDTDSQRSAAALGGGGKAHVSQIFF